MEENLMMRRGGKKRRIEKKVGVEKRSQNQLSWEEEGKKKEKEREKGKTHNN